MKPSVGLFEPRIVVGLAWAPWINWPCWRLLPCLLCHLPGCFETVAATRVGSPPPFGIRSPTLADVAASVCAGLAELGCFCLGALERTGLAVLVRTGLFALERTVLAKFASQPPGLERFD